MIDISNLEKCAEPLNEEKFWQIVAKSLEESNNENEQEASLIKQIALLSPKEMIGFRLRTDKLLHDSYTSELWCAAYIIKEGCGDDGFEYFRNWLISKGKEPYYQALENPDTLIDFVSTNGAYYEFESFWYVALEAFNKTTSKDLYDYIDNEKFTECEGSYPAIDLHWNEGESETMKAIAPKLFEKCWN